MEGNYPEFNCQRPTISCTLLIYLFLFLNSPTAASVKIVSPEIVDGLYKTNQSPLFIRYLDGADTLDTSITLKSGANQLSLISSTNDSSNFTIDYRSMITFTRNFPTHSIYYTNKPLLQLRYSLLFLDSLSDPANEIFTIDRDLKREGANNILIDTTDDYGNRIVDSIMAFMDSSPAAFQLAEDWSQVHVSKMADSIYLEISPFEFWDSSGIEEIKASVSYYQGGGLHTLTTPIPFSNISLRTSIGLAGVDSLFLKIQIRDKALNDTSFNYSYYKDSEGPRLSFEVFKNIIIQDSEAEIRNLPIEDPNFVKKAAIIFYPETDSAQELPLIYSSDSKTYGLENPYKLNGKKADFIFTALDTLENEFRSEKRQFYLQSTKFDWRNKAQKKWQLIGFPRAVKSSELEIGASGQKSTWQLENGQFVFRENLDPWIYPGQGFLWGSYSEAMTLKDGWWISPPDSIEVNPGWNIVSLLSDEYAKASNYNTKDLYQIKYIENSPTIVKIESRDTLLPYSGYLYWHREESVNKIPFPIPKASEKKSPATSAISFAVYEKISGRKVYIHPAENTPLLSLPQSQNRFYFQTSGRKWLQLAADEIEKSILIYESAENHIAEFDFFSNGEKMEWFIVELKTGVNVTNSRVNLTAGINSFALISKTEYRQNKSFLQNLISYKIVNGTSPESSKLIVKLGETFPAGFPINLHIFNLKGIELRRLPFFLSAKSESFLFETPQLNSGTYFYRLKSSFLPSQPFQKMVVCQ